MEINRKYVSLIIKRTLFVFGFFLIPGLSNGSETSLPAKPTTALKQAREPVRTQKETRAERLFKDGTKLMTSEQYSRAIAKLKLSVRLWPDLAEAHSNLGYCYRKQKLYGKAIPAYLEAIRLKPNLVEAREYLAEAYAELAALYREKAREELEVLQTLDQEEAEAVEMLMRKLDL